MPVDASGLPTPPTDPKEIGRRLARLERLVEVGGASRALTSASVGRGGIRVKDGGSITIDTGGDLEIVTGNLVLGEGKIDGAALKEQLEPATKQTTAATFAASTSYAAKASFTISRPAWATSTIVQATAIVRMQLTGKQDYVDLDGDVRINIDGDRGLENVLPANAAAGDLRLSGVATHAYESTSSSIRVAVEVKARESGAYGKHSSNRAELSAIIIFKR